MTPLFLDVDTQNDFVLPAGALYAPGAERVISVVAGLNRLAMEQGFALVSTACSHSEDDPEFQIWGPHCVQGTFGFLKPAETLVGQPIFEKQDVDVFRNERFAPLLRALDPSEYIVYGVVTEVCVRFAAEGLLGLGKPVTVISDAVHPFDKALADAFLMRFIDGGGSVATADEVRARF